MKIVTVHDKMQQGYSYALTEPVGKNFDPEFTPDLTPKEMLALGIFNGKYMNDCTDEFPTDWYTHKKDTNYFGVKASQPLSVWRAKGWINEAHDPRGCSASPIACARCGCAAGTGAGSAIRPAP
jgi:hypothetical protein